MLLVPRQLQRSGMTGSVPYYGGRLSPAQAWAASHPSESSAGVPAGVTGVAAAHAPVHSAGSVATSSPARPEATSGTADAAVALRQLRDSGVLSEAEYADLLGRTRR